MPAKITWKGEELSIVSNSWGLRPEPKSAWEENSDACQRDPCSLPSKLVNSVTIFLLVPLNNLYKKLLIVLTVKSVDKHSFLFQYLHWDSSDDPSAQWGQAWWLQDLGEQGAHQVGSWRKHIWGRAVGRKGRGWAPSHRIGSPMLQQGGPLHPTEFQESSYVLGEMRWESTWCSVHGLESPLGSQVGRDAPWENGKVRKLNIVTCSQALPTNFGHPVARDSKLHASLSILLWHPT